MFHISNSITKSYSKPLKKIYENWGLFFLLHQVGDVRPKNKHNDSNESNHDPNVTSSS